MGKGARGGDCLKAINYAPRAAMAIGRLDRMVSAEPGNVSR